MFCVICMVNLRGSHVKTPSLFSCQLLKTNCKSKLPSVSQEYNKVLIENWIVTKRDRKTSKREQRASRE